MNIKWIFLFFLCFPAWGYNFTQDFLNGFYWASLPLNMIVVEKDAQRKAFLEKLTEFAMNEWESSTGLDLWDLSGQSNIIRWSENFSEETRMDSTSVLAVAIRYTSGPYFAKSEIIINGKHESFNTPYSSINKMNLATTLVHELGHTIGLDHSENMSAIMAPTLQYPYSGLHQDDLEGMEEIHIETMNRQATNYLSPLAFREEPNSTKPLSCATVGVTPQGPIAGVPLSFGLGILIGFCRRIIKRCQALISKFFLKNN